MDTSLRCGSGANSLKLHAKEKFALAPQVFLQGHAEIDTKIGAPNFLAILVRRFYPQTSASMGLGIEYNGNKELTYSIRGKKTFPLTSSGLVNVNMKGRFDVDKDFRERKNKLAAELTLGILNFQTDQDLRLKLGYEAFNKVPYFQLRENCWTLNVDSHGKWNVRYCL
ncbi:outer envelope pore protein 21, chloroplastic-like [Wolffia australiana]